MAASNENSERRVVPRWRPFREALANNELSAAVVAAAPTFDGGPFMAEKESAWLEHKALPFALDLVSAAAVLGESEASKEAAVFILESNPGSSISGQSIARHILGILSPPPARGISSRSEIIRAVKELKSRRLSQMRNAFVWVDLARLYILLDQIESARHTMRVALTLAPTDRFVLRSATRMLLHSKAPDEALHLLRKNSRTPADPWLIAAEIAVSSVLDKDPKFAKAGQRILKSSDVPPFHLSELASALGSFEMFEGNLKHARRFFAFSLTKPTDNALAQAAWASKRAGLSEIDETLLLAPHVSEAQAITAHNRGKWNDVLHYARIWTEDEPFSARPRQLASATASSLLDQFSIAEQIAIEGLVTNPGHPGLINNIAFALASQGRASEAMAQLEKLDKSQMTRTDSICLIATAGLALFRAGNIEDGRKHYEAAIHAAAVDKNQNLRILATLYYNRERIFVKDPKALKEFSCAVEEAKKIPNASLSGVAEHLAAEVTEFAVRESQRLF